MNNSLNSIPDLTIGETRALLAMDDNDFACMNTGSITKTGPSTYKVTFERDLNPNIKLIKYSNPLQNAMKLTIITDNLIKNVLVKNSTQKNGVIQINSKNQVEFSIDIDAKNDDEAFDFLMKLNDQILSDCELQYDSFCNITGLRKI